MATVTTAAISANTSLVPAPGQAWIGSHVNSDQQVFSQRAIFGGGIAAGGVIPTVTITPGSGTVASLTAQSGYDMAFSFTYTAGSASIFGGTLASVKYGQPLTAAPSAVIVNAAYTSGTVGLNAGAAQVTAAGFNICGGAPTSGGTITVNCVTVRSPL